LKNGDCAHPEGVLPRKGLEERGAAAQAVEPPQSPVFCGVVAKNVPNYSLFMLHS
jgi:hypothetical protein